MTSLWEEEKEERKLRIQAKGDEKIRERRKRKIIRRG